MSRADLARDHLDAQLVVAYDNMWTLVVAAENYGEHARRLRAAQARGRCVGLEDLLRATYALEQQRRCLQAVLPLVLQIARLQDRRRGDGLATLEAEIRRELETRRQDLQEPGLPDGTRPPA